MKLQPLKQFGQHFLIDHTIAEQIVSFAEIKSDEWVWEIGPGTGVLTEKILSHTHRFTAFEIDNRLYEILNKKFDNKFVLINQDILAISWDELLKQQIQKPVLISNLPYQITSPILEKLEKHYNRFVRSILMIQKEVADRLTASSGNRAYGVLTLVMRSKFEIIPLLQVPPLAFDPPPQVNSTVIKLIPRKTPLKVKSFVLYKRLIKQAFQHKRKTLRNNLKPYYKPEVLQSLEKQTGIDLNLRGEQVSENDFIRIADYLFDYSISNYSSSK